MEGHPEHNCSKSDAAHTTPRCDSYPRLEDSPREDQDLECNTNVEPVPAVAPLSSIPPDDSDCESEGHNTDPGTYAPLTGATTTQNSGGNWTTSAKPVVPPIGGENGLSAFLATIVSNAALAPETQPINLFESPKGENGLSVVLATIASNTALAPETPSVHLLESSKGNSGRINSISPPGSEKSESCQTSPRGGLEADGGSPRPEDLQLNIAGIDNLSQSQGDRTTFSGFHIMNPADQGDTFTQGATEHSDDHLMLVFPAHDVDPMVCTTSSERWPPEFINPSEKAHTFRTEEQQSDHNDSDDLSTPTQEAEPDDPGSAMFTGSNFFSMFGSNDQMQKSMGKFDIFGQSVESGKTDKATTDAGKTHSETLGFSSSALDTQDKKTSLWSRRTASDPKKQPLWISTQDDRESEQTSESSNNSSDGTYVNDDVLKNVEFWGGYWQDQPVRYSRNLQALEIENLSKDAADLEQPLGADVGNLPSGAPPLPPPAGGDMQLIPSEDPIDLTSWHVEYYLGDWAAYVVLCGIFAIMVTHMNPFEQQYDNRLDDWTILYDWHDATVARPVGWMLASCFPAIVFLILSCGCQRGNYAKELSQSLSGLFCSIVLSAIAANFLSMQVGRLSPDFIARCLPSDVGICATVRNHRNNQLIEYGRASWPSSQASWSFSGLGYLSISIHAKLRHVSRHVLAGELWKSVVASGPLFLATYMGLSTMKDNSQHWDDVVIGASLGLLIAYGVYRLRCPSIFVHPHCGSV